MTQLSSGVDYAVIFCICCPGTVLKIAASEALHNVSVTKYPYVH